MLWPYSGVNCKKALVRSCCLLCGQCPYCTVCLADILAFSSLSEDGGCLRITLVLTLSAWWPRVHSSSLDIGSVICSEGRSAEYTEKRESHGSSLEYCVEDEESLSFRYQDVNEPSGYPQ